jgi:hypothetical protein
LKFCRAKKKKNLSSWAKPACFDFSSSNVTSNVTMQESHTEHRWRCSLRFCCWFTVVLLFVEHRWFFAWQSFPVPVLWKRLNFIFLFFILLFKILII